MRKKGSSIQKRLYMLLLVCLVPLVIMVLYLLYMINNFSQRYNRIVENITAVSSYSIDFKENIDYTMYIIVVNMERAAELVDTEQPHGMIKEAREDFLTLYHNASSEYAQSQIWNILKTLNTLEDRVEEIEADALVSGAYDKNMERLDMNIRVLTQLIQEQIQEYIKYETARLETLRKGIQADVGNAIRIGALVFGTILAGAIFISRKIMTGITVPIRMLSEATKQAASGDFAVRAQEDSDDELTVLNTSFNRMIEKIGYLVEDIRIEQQNLRQAELKLLQAQINPHFLYNTLDSIIWLAEAGEKEQVVQMVSALSDFFRTTLSKGKDYITLEEEEMHIQSYLQIQQLRYRDILTYDIRIPDELRGNLILKLTLQPLVENALYHGIKNKRSVGHIEVTGRTDGEKMIFCVCDDGIGMTQERLSYIQAVIQGKQSDEKISAGFGLFNVNQRIQLNYGPEFGLTIDSIYGTGTEAAVTIPIVNSQTFSVKKSIECS